MPHFHIWSMSSEIYSKSLLNPAVLSPYLPVNHEFFGTQHSPLLHHTLCENRIFAFMRFSHKMNLEVTYVPHSKTDCKILGENIRLLRKAHRLSQKQMAAIAGISIYSLRKTEQGILPFSLCADTLIRISRHFHLRPATLFAPQEDWNVKLLLNGEEDI